MLNDVGIHGKWVPRRGVVENYVLVSAHDVPNERLRQHGGNVGAVWQIHGYILSSNGRFRLYLQLVTSRNNQEASLGACVLDGRPHEPVDQFLQDHLARHSLRNLEDSPEIEPVHGPCYRACRTRWRHFRLEPRMKLIKLFDLS